MKRLLFDVPLWHLFLHRHARWLARAEEDDAPTRMLEDELFERLYTGGGEQLEEEHRDLSRAAWAEKVHETCEQLPSFSRLVDECRGDADAAALAVEALVEELDPVLSGTEADEQTMRRLVSNGCASSSTRIDEMRDAQEGLGGVGFGDAPGSAREEGTTGKPLAVRLRSDERLKRIALLAGRFKRIAAQKRRQQTRHGADEVVDVELGNDLGRLVPAELVRLVHPRQRLAFLRDYTERRCMQYRLAGTESLGRGPLVVCLDKSDSMSGTPDIWATAVTLALLEVAQTERRTFSVLCFTTVTTHEVVVPPGGLLPLETLSVPCSGGTDIGRVLGNALDVVERSAGELRNADIVLVTDGQSRTASAPGIRSRASSLGVTVLGVGIGVEEEGLKVWCDEAHVVRDTNQLNDETATSLFG